MRFKHQEFSCDIDIFHNEDDIVVRFYDKKKEQKADAICNYVKVDPGFGFLCLKVKGENGLLSGYLLNSIFSNNEIVEAAIEFVEKLSVVKNGYVPHLVRRVKTVKENEYNGEW